MSKIDDNQSLAMVVGLLLIVIFLLGVLTMAVIWIKKNYLTFGDQPDEKTDDRQLFANLTRLKAELTPDVYRALQRTIVNREPAKLAIIASALDVGLERGGEHPGFGNMLLTLGLSDTGEMSDAFLIGAVAIYEKRFGADHPETVTTLGVVARNMARRNSQYAGAYLEHTINAFQTVLPEDPELPKIYAVYETFCQTHGGAEAVRETESSGGEEVRNEVSDDGQTNEENAGENA